MPMRKNQNRSSPSAFLLTVHSASILKVLQTAVPTSIALDFLTNSAAVYSSIASDLAASSTPSWIAALPSDAKSYIIGAVESPSAVSSAIASITSASAGSIITSSPVINASTIAGNVTSSLLATLSNFNSSISSAILAGNGTAIVVNGTAIAGNGTAFATGNSTRSGLAGASASATRSSAPASRSGSQSSGASGSSATSTGGAAIQTALGMSLVGAVGLVGAFVL
jgi:hypothetical protein